MSDTVRLVLRRASSQREVLAVAAAVLLVTVVLVTACGVALRVASQSGVRAGLDRAAAADRVVVVSGNPTDAAALAQADTAVRRALTSAVTPAPAGVQRRTVSASYALDGGAERDRLVLGVYEGAQQHARLTEGSWPTGDDQVAVPRPAAEALGLAVGDDLRLLGQDGRVLTATVSGSWEPRDPADSFWAEDPLGPVGVTQDGGFRTFGPFLLPDDAADGGVGRLVGPRVSWLSTPDLAALPASVLDRVGSRVDALEQDGARDLSASLPDARVVTRLNDVLRALGPSLSAARTSVTVPTLLLLALAAASLALAGRVVAEARAGDVRLRESRGYSRLQVLRSAGAEMLVLGAVVGAVGPWVAPLLVRGVLAATGTSSTVTTLEPADWLWAGGAALLGVVVLTRAAADGTSGPGPASTGWRRLLPSPRQVVEVLVLVLAAVAWQQSGAAGSPTLVSAAAPTLVVLAVLLVVARLVPLLTGVAGGWVGRTRGLLSSLVGWELSRRVEQQRSSLVTTGLAAAVTVFLAGLVTSWAVSQDDQAAVRTAAPVRVTGLSTAEADDLAGDLGGVTVERRTAGLPSGTGTVLVVPRDDATGVLDSPVDGGWPRLLDRLAGSGRDEVPALVTPSVAAQAGDGDSLSLQLADTNVRVRVVGVLPALPTSSPTDPVLLVDRDALAAQLGGRTPARALSSDDTELWTDAPADRVSAAAPSSAVVLDRHDVAQDLRTGPVGTGLLAGSVLALVAAAMLGVLACLSDTATTMRVRRRELASLRAQGLSRRRLVQAVALERGALLVAATLLGAATGWLAVRLFLGRLVLADSGVLPSPAAEATAPWLLLAGGTTAALVLLVTLVAVAAARVARRPLGSDLRETT